MPKELTKTIYKCIYCHKGFETEEEATKHEEIDHDIIYVPMERADLNGLLNFIVTNDNNQQLLTERLMKTLFAYTKAK